MPVNLTIDNRPVTVEDGATILDAARALGIEIPTMCHRDGVAPFASCFLCVVRVERRRHLVPSCAAPAAADMIVTTDSDEIRAARRMALELLLSDHVGDCVAPCTLACPAGMDIPAMNRHLAAGREREALAVVRERIAFPGALGRICPRYCERVCRRGDLDEAIAICALKRFTADANDEAAEPYVPTCAPSSGKRVAIVGAGPAGLAAAFHLRQEGHACTVFDRNAAPGGMFRYALPEFRLPRQALEREIESLRRLGVEFRLNTTLGVDVTLPQLQRQYDAVFVALGAAGARTRAGADGTIEALEFLRCIAEGKRPDAGDRVVVLGGGNEAVDAARSALRLGAGRAMIVWDKERATIPAFAASIEAALAEGVTLACETRTLSLQPSPSGRFIVVLESADGELSVDASSVIAAPERSVDAEVIKGLGLPFAGRGIAVERRTLATDLPGVFAGGEVVSGPTAGVRAVAAGRLAAVSIDQFLRGEAVVGEAATVNVLMGKLSDEERAAYCAGVVTATRAAQEVLPAQERARDWREVESGLPPADVEREAARCLQCDCLARDDCKLRRYAAEYGAKVSAYRGARRRFARDATHPAVVYESGKCILCGLCVRMAEQAGERPGIGFARRGFDTVAAVPFGKTLDGGLPQVARRCAEACPTGALAVKRGGDDSTE